MILRILCDSENTRYNIREFGFDSTVRAYQTWKSHNRRNPFETQTVSNLKSEHTYALVTTKGLHWDTMPLCYSTHAPPRADCAWMS
ncbi:unnamed protein product [Prunus armeniaca]